MVAAAAAAAAAESYRKAHDVAVITVYCKVMLAACVNTQQIPSLVLS